MTSEAFDNIDKHVKRLNLESKVLVAPVQRTQAAMDSGAKSIANMIAPAAFEVSSLASVKDEIFGPVLQIVRWGSGDLATPEAVMDQINALGFGLTLGGHRHVALHCTALHCTVSMQKNCCTSDAPMSRGWRAWPLRPCKRTKTFAQYR